MKNRILFALNIGLAVGLLLGGGALVVHAAGNAQKMGMPKAGGTCTSAASVAVDDGLAATIYPSTLCIDNEDTTNFIRVGTDNTVSATLHGTKVGPGQSKCFPGAQKFWCKADTADVTITATPFGVGL